MSADLTAAHEALREILAGLDASVAHLREIADGLRDKPESELPPEPSYEIDGRCTYFVDRYGLAWQNNVNFIGWWQGSEGTRRTWGGLWAESGPLVQLVRADQTVVLPSEFPSEPVVEWRPSGTSLRALVRDEFDRLTVTARHIDHDQVLSALIPLADAERWLLDVLALVRGKGGA